MSEQDAILVLEDVVDVAAVLADFLRDRGHTVLVAHTGREALATLADRPVGLLLLDLELPDMHGTAVMRRARRVDHPPEVVVITGHAALASAVEAVEAGAGGYVIKPVDLPRLGVIVDRILSRRRLQRDNERLTADNADRRRETEALLAVSSAVATLDLREALRRICRELTRLVGADTCAAYVHEAATDQLVALAGYRVPRQLASSFLVAPLPLREAGELAPPWRERRPVFSDDVPGDARFAHDAFRRYRHQSGLLLPLVLDGEVAGAFYLVWWRTRHRASERELGLAEAVAAQAALLLKATRLADAARLRSGAAGARRAAEIPAADPAGADGDMARLKSDFVSFITHQLWTPLAGIKWMLELARRDQSLSAETSSYIADAGSAAERLIKLVTDLVAVSRLERGSIAIARRDVDLAELTRRVLDETASAAGERGLRLSLVLGAEPLTALGDARLIRQALLNLLSNAIKYSPAGGEIAVDVRGDDEEVRWSVRDPGIGVPAGAVSRVFEKFYRADNAAQVETEGTGLGLYAVRLIVDRLGGRAWCESEEGHGATFALTLPRPGGPEAGAPVGTS